MPTNEPLVERIQQLVVHAEQDRNVRVGRHGWPILREQLACWEFLHHRQEDLSRIRSLQERLEGELKGDPGYSRGRWLKDMLNGLELFRDSRSCWAVEFGDPFHPEGIPPHRPREGQRVLVDPELGRVLVFPTEVDLPPAEGFESEIDPREREALASLEPVLRRLAVEAIRGAPWLKVVEHEDQWPALLYEELILDRPFIEEVERQVIEYEARHAESDALSFRRLLDAATVYRVGYGDGVWEPRFSLWMAPEIQHSFAASTFSCGAVLLVDEDIRRIGREPRPDPCNLQRYHGIAEEAAARLDLEHERKLLREVPELAFVVDRVRSTGIDCLRCGERITEIRAIQVRGGLRRLNCGHCIYTMILDRSGWPQAPECCELCGRGGEGQGPLERSGGCPLCGGFPG